MRGQYKQISSKNCYNGKHMQVFCDQVMYPNGDFGVYEHYKKNDIVVVIPIYKRKFVLIKQFRYLAKSRLIEFPMGLLHNGETVKEGGIRELHEETGFKTSNVKYLGKCFLNKGSSSQTCHFVLTKVNRTGKPIYDNSESDIDILYMQSEELKSMIKQGKIIDGPTIIGYSLYNLE